MNKITVTKTKFGLKRAAEILMLLCQDQKINLVHFAITDAFAFDVLAALNSESYHSTQNFFVGETGIHIYTTTDNTRVPDGAIVGVDASGKRSEPLFIEFK